MNASVEAAFDRFYRSIRQAADIGTLLCIEDALPCFALDVFDACDTLVLVSKKRAETETIIPTLSILRLRQSQPRKLSSLRDLLSILPSLFKLNPLHDGKRTNDPKPVRNLGTVLAAAAQDGFVEWHKIAGVAILRRGKSHVRRAGLRILADAIRIICQSSLNQLNESLDIRDEETVRCERDYFHPMVDETCRRIAANAGARYRVDAFALLHSHKEDRWVVEGAPQLGPQPLSPLETAAILRDIPGSPKPFIGRTRGAYFLVIPMARRSHRTARIGTEEELSDVLFAEPKGGSNTTTSDGVVRRRRRFRAALLLRSAQPIPRYVLTNILHQIQLYFDSYRQAERLACIAGLQRTATTLLRRVPLTARSREGHPLSEFKPFVQEALAKLVQLTSAFSATCRLFDPISRRLVLFAECGDYGAEGTSETERWTSIGLSEGGVNVQTFLDSHKRYRYEEDLSKLRSRAERYRDRRVAAESELCVTFVYKNVRLGVINLESPIPSGFDDDIKFVINVVDAVENQLILLLESNDKRWLSGREQIQQSMHELAALIEDPGLSPIYKRRIRACISEPLATTQRCDEDTLHALQRYRDGYFDALESAGLETPDMKRGCKLHLINPSLKVSGYWLECVGIVYKNLLDNFRKYCDHQRDTLVVDERPHDGLLSARIEVDLYASRRFTADQLSQLLVTPIEDEMRRHWGLFLVGALSRQLGGFAYAGNADRAGGRVRVVIPIEAPL